MIDVTVKAKQDGTGAEDGMRVLELERTLRRLRANGAKDDTQLDVVVNRQHRVRSVSTVGLEDDDLEDLERSGAAQVVTAQGGMSAAEVAAGVGQRVGTTEDGWGHP